MTKILPGYQQFSLPDLQGKKIEVGNADSPSFLQVFKDMVNETNQLQTDASDIAQKFALGQVSDIHDVMIAAEKAGVSFELVMEIRNKLIEAYQEIMRMQV